MNTQSLLAHTSDDEFPEWTEEELALVPTVAEIAASKRQQKREATRLKKAATTRLNSERAAANQQRKQSLAPK